MNAYEIRTEILKMAKETVGERYYQEKEVWDSTVDRDENGKALNRRECPTPPTIEDVMKEASTMYEFVKLHK